jgi:NADPH2:quinone reductase
MNMAARTRWSGRSCPCRTPSRARRSSATRRWACNYIDVYFRTGLYKAPSLPATIGMEGAGHRRGGGRGVAEVAAGDRVAYATGPIGAYAEARALKADRW